MIQLTVEWFCRWKFQPGRSNEAKAGGVVSHFPTTFQSLINISFPKIFLKFIKIFASFLIQATQIFLLTTKTIC
jgi:hypothetical protein